MVPMTAATIAGSYRRQEKIDEWLPNDIVIHTGTLTVSVIEHFSDDAKRP